MVVVGWVGIFDWSDVVEVLGWFELIAFGWSFTVDLSGFIGDHVELVVMLWFEFDVVFVVLLLILVWFIDEGCGCCADVFVGEIVCFGEGVVFDCGLVLLVGWVFFCEVFVHVVDVHVNGVLVGWVCFGLFCFDVVE